LGFSKDEQRQTAVALTEFINDHRETLGLMAEVPIAIPSFHPMYRTDRSGSVRWDMVVEVLQKLTDPKGFPVRGGTTMIISTHGTRGSGEAGAPFLRYAIKKPQHGPGGERRAKKQQAFFSQEGLKGSGDPRNLRVNFAFLHGGE
jgi:hypothetical protein